jgi:hypothetical protein
MAATGLLGFNPYNTKGLTLDISSKPTNLAIQLEQKEQAKKEALDKYFMDYEKSLNPAGMRGVDQDAFLGKLGEAKQYYLQNRDKILNPAKYGAEAQSTYNSHLREAQNLIAQSKAQAADDKVVSEHIYQATQKGDSIPDILMPMIDASHLSIVDPRFKKVDPYSLKFDQPFKLDQFEKSVFAGVEPNKKDVGYRTNSAGQVINQFQNEYDNQSLKVFENRAKALYESNPSVTREVNRLIKTGEYKALEPYYQKLYPKQSLDAASPSHVAAALALSLKQLGKTTESAPVFRPSGPQQEQYNPEEHLDRIIAESPGNIGSITVNGKTIEGTQINLPEALKNKYGEKIDNTTTIPDYFLITKNKGSLYPVYVSGKTKSGNDIITSGNPISVVNDLLPAMGEQYAGKAFLRKNPVVGLSNKNPTKNETITVILDGKTGEIPANNWGAFLKKHPNAKKQ